MTFVILYRNFSTKKRPILISPEVWFASLHLSFLRLSSSTLKFCSVSAAQSAGGLRCIHTKICAVRGTTVDIRCFHGKSPSARGGSIKPEKAVWFIEVQDQQPVDLREDPAYSGRIKYFCEKTTCTLRIAALRESDSAVYRFSYRGSRKKELGASPGVSLSVTGSGYSKNTSYLFLRPDHTVHDPLLLHFPQLQRYTCR